MCADGIPLRTNQESYASIEERMQAAADTAVDYAASRVGCYVDAASGKSGAAVASVVDWLGVLSSVATIRSRNTETAEELVIALACLRIEVNFIISDSKTASWIFGKGGISPEAAKVLTSRRKNRKICLSWTLAHTSVPGNEADHELARALCFRFVCAPRFNGLATAARLQPLSMSFGGRHRVQGGLARSSLSQIASSCRRWFGGRHNSRIPGRLAQGIGVGCRDVGDLQRYRVAAFHGIGPTSVPHPYYTADFGGVTENEAISWPPTAAVLLISSVGLFMVSEDISANVWPQNDHGLAESNDFEPPESWSPPSDIRVRTQIPARRQTSPRHRDAVGTSKPTLRSSTPRSDAHHHGPRYADDDGASETAGRVTTAASGARETRERDAVDVDGEHPPKHGCSSALHTYCVKVRDEYYYQPAVNACVMTATDSTVVCNHSGNKFVSHGSCRKNCVDSEVPNEKCFQTATFSKCTRYAARRPPQVVVLRRLELPAVGFPFGRLPIHDGRRRRRGVLQLARVRPVLRTRNSRPASPSPDAPLHATGQGTSAPPTNSGRRHQWLCSP
ncbi:hypothetical protein HPB50_014780 [Hyalomma asiaticum]|uniref:Uncharacterized protein n=1 Tax=Hyalomma asiaticum TaxID=266040 RepID=A0ACB7S6G2_HYAAI|nr:hypothetical protein HPB50_014780 [Hyalomma asiaticum]